MAALAYGDLTKSPRLVYYYAYINLFIFLMAPESYTGWADLCSGVG